MMHSVSDSSTPLASYNVYITYIYNIVVQCTISTGAGLCPHQCHPDEISNQRPLFGSNGIVPQSQVGKALSAKENEFGNVHQGVNLDKNKWLFLLRPQKQVGAQTKNEGF